MANLQRRAIENLRNENTTVPFNKQGPVKATKGIRSNRPVLANISNIQRRPALGTKLKKEQSEHVHKGLSRNKAATHLNVPEKSDVFIFKDEIDEEEEMKNMRLENDEIAKLTEQLAEVEVEDIDADDLTNPSLCAEYVKDIYKYMHKLEKKLQPSDYMSRQTNINRKMRSILVDWLIQVQSRFDLLQETLYLTIYTIDRFLDKCDVSRSELQLVGVTGMLIASKYEEMFAPEIGDFVYITDNAYSKVKIRAMEQKMLKACEFDFSNPLCLHFLRRNSKAGAVDAKKHTLAKYLMEITLVDYELSLLLPSQIAATASYLSTHLIDKQSAEWTSTLAHYSGYTEDSIYPIVCKLAKLVLSLEGSKYNAAKNKYSQSKFMKISRLPDLTGSYMQDLANKDVEGL